MLVLTQGKESMHRDHATTSAIVRDAVLLAALPGISGVDGPPAHIFEVTLRSFGTTQEAA